MIGAAGMAPLAAASPCPPVTMSWTNFSVTTNTATDFVLTGSILTSAGTNTVVLTSPRPAGSDQSRLIDGPDGGYGPPTGVYPNFLGTSLPVPNARFLEMFDSSGAGCRSYTLTFTLPVTNLVLPFADIDSVTNGTSFEEVQLLTPGFVELFQGSQVVQSGSTYTAVVGNSAATNSTAPCTGPPGATNCPSESGNVTVMYPGPLSSVSWNHCRTGDVNLTADLFAVSWQPC